MEDEPKGAGACGWDSEARPDCELRVRSRSLSVRKAIRWCVTIRTSVTDCEWIYVCGNGMAWHGRDIPDEWKVQLEGQEGPNYVKLFGNLRYVKCHTGNISRFTGEEQQINKVREVAGTWAGGEVVGRDEGNKP